MDAKGGPLCLHNANFFLPLNVCDTYVLPPILEVDGDRNHLTDLDFVRLGGRGNAVRHNDASKKLPSPSGSCPPVQDWLTA